MESKSFKTEAMLELLEQGMNKQQVAVALGAQRHQIYDRLYKIQTDPKYRKRIKRIDEVKHVRGYSSQHTGQYVPPLEAGRPVQAREAITEDRVNRRLWCIHYDGCLTYAAKKRWMGFSCKGCKDVQEEKPTADEFIRVDAGRCAMLLFRTSIGE